ncbi:hypothetical protein DESA109040_13805 [Deinococcus saxicola]|uniref:hypothetical protein n=1 Tax=Deinococcus saxicola TaxID=249406 RepID=UPI0039F13B2A
MKRLLSPSNLLYILAILCAFCGAGSSDLTPLTPVSLSLIAAAIAFGVLGARAEALEDARVKLEVRV